MGIFTHVLITHIKNFKCYAPLMIFRAEKSSIITIVITPRLPPEQVEPPVISKDGPKSAVITLFAPFERWNFGPVFDSYCMTDLGLWADIKSFILCNLATVTVTSRE